MVKTFGVVMSCKTVLENIMKAVEEQEEDLPISLDGTYNCNLVVLG